MRFRKSLLKSGSAAEGEKVSTPNDASRDYAQMRKNEEVMHMDYETYFIWVALGMIFGFAVSAFAFIAKIKSGPGVAIWFLAMVVSSVICTGTGAGFGTHEYRHTHHGTAFVEAGTEPRPRIGGFAVGVLVADLISLTFVAFTIF
jgi:hypothetical protein